MLMLLSSLVNHTTTLKLLFLISVLIEKKKKKKKPITCVPIVPLIQLHSVRILIHYLEEGDVSDYDALSVQISVN